MKIMRYLTCNLLEMIIKQAIIMKHLKHKQYFKNQELNYLKLYKHKITKGMNSSYLIPKHNIHPTIN